MEEEINLLACLCLFCIAHTRTIIATKSTVSTFVKSNYCQLKINPILSKWSCLQNDGRGALCRKPVVHIHASSSLIHTKKQYFKQIWFFKNISLTSSFTSISFRVISPDFSLESTGFFQGKHLIQFLVLKMKHFRNFVLHNCILVFDAGQVYLKLQVINLKNKEVTINPKPQTLEKNWV